LPLSNLRPVTRQSARQNDRGNPASEPISETSNIAVSGLESSKNTITTDIDRIYTETRQIREHLQTQVLDLDGRESSPKSHSSANKGRNNIRIKNIPVFTYKFTIQQRQDWLNDQEFTFKISLKRFKTDYKRILKAYRYTKGKDPIKRRNVKNS
ncbi:uncharacterized protein N7482_010053, partial [Penicillium canariense]